MKTQGLDIINSMSEIMNSDSFQNKFYKKAQVAGGLSTELANLDNEMNKEDNGWEKTNDDKNKDLAVRQAIGRVRSTRPGAEPDQADLKLVYDFVKKENKPRYTEKVPTLIAKFETYKQAQVAQPGNLSTELYNLDQEMNKEDNGSQKTNEDKNRDLAVRQAISRVRSVRPGAVADEADLKLVYDFVKLQNKPRYTEKVPTLLAKFEGKTASIIDSLVKIADYLGEEEMFTSEAMVDDIIESIISEAGKKKELKKLFEKAKKTKKEDKKSEKKDEDEDEDDDK